jgi:hypothetical protein
VNFHPALISNSYRRHELGFRTSIYISAASASGAFGGLLAIGFSSIPQWGMIQRWRNIFFFEVCDFPEDNPSITNSYKGVISILLSVIAFVCIPKGPVEAKFLTEEEKIVAVDRLRLDAAGTSENSAKTKWKHIWQAISSPHTLVCGLGFFFGKCVSPPPIISQTKMRYSTAAQTFSVFSPSIIAAMGYSSTRAQLLSVGPYVSSSSNLTSLL